MKTRLTTIIGLGAISASIANAEITLTEDLSLYGYIDMFALETDTPGDSFEANVGEIELGFSYTTEPVFAVAELSFRGVDSDVQYETVVVGWNVNDSLSFSAGHILSYLGWEAYDATGLYQFSYAYRGFSPGYPAYAVGAAMDYVTDAYSFGVWVGETDGDISYEVAGKFTGVEGLTLFLGYANDPGYETINTWASYETGAFTFAVEYFHWDDEFFADRSGGLAMVNYAVEKFGLTVRYSIEDTDGEPEDWELLTFSPSYAFSDNLLGLLEYSAILDGGGGADYQIAAEFVYAF